MKKYYLSVIVLIIFIISPVHSQFTAVEKGLEAITTDAIKAQLGFLSSEWMEGRMAGEKGEFMSADYIASLLQIYGVKPGGDLYQMANSANSFKTADRTYFQNFLLLRRTPGDEQILKIKTTEGQSTETTNFTFNVDFTFRQALPSVETEAPVVFVGYGFKSERLKYNDLNKLDLKGKYILKISGVPEFARTQLSMMEVAEAERGLETLARSVESAGIIEIYPNALVVGPQARKEFNNMSPAENNPRSSQSNISYSIPGKINPDNIPRIYVSVKTANEILKGTGINLEDYIKKADANSPYNLLPVTGKMLYLKTTSSSSTVAVRNVLGIIEGNSPDQIMVLGAHYDHMGMSNGFIWNGADDNASGVVGVLSLAKAIMATGKKPDKTIIFAFWTAEEEGLLGSRYYVQNLTYPLKNLKMNLNFDMISRYTNDNDPKKVTMTYTSSNTGFKDITVANQAKYGIDLVIDYQPSADPPGGSDHRSFVAAGIPIMRFKPGHREEYHTPDDEFNTVDWDIMEKIIKISFTNVWELANTEW